MQEKQRNQLRADQLRPGQMEPITLPSGEVVGISDQAKMFLLHQVLPFPYLEQSEMPSTSAQDRP